MIGRSTRLILVLMLALQVVTVASAQTPATITPGARVRVDTAAPVYLLPDATRTPLRTLPVGMTAVALRRDAEWVQITFEDPQFGRRTGWIQAQFVTVIGAAEPAAPENRRPAPGVGASPTDRRPPAKTAQPASRAGANRPGARLFGSFAFDRMAAAQSFAAITGNDGFVAFGGGIQGVNLWHGLFAETSVERMTAKGERAFVFGGTVHRLGIPVTIETTPVDVIAGWRVPLGRVTPFAAGGLNFTRYRETSDFADEDENVQRWHNGFVALAGVETRVTPTVHIRGEFRWRELPDALGQGGVSREFAETSLGGVGGSLKIVFGR